MPARYVFLDEVDAYPASADEEGDPVGLAEARSLTFAHRRKLFLVSTPTIRGVSRIEREYEASDQRRYFVPCPKCGAVQWLRFERLRWEKGRPETAAYWCEHCEQAVPEHHKGAMLASGKWRSTATAQDQRTIGFHLSALYSPPGWKSWADIARDKEAAAGSDEAERVFRNTMLGETWVETGEAPDWQRLADRREDWPAGVVPAGGLFLTAGADVQKDRILRKAIRISPNDGTAEVRVHGGPRAFLRTFMAAEELPPASAANGKISPFKSAGGHVGACARAPPQLLSRYGMLGPA